MIAFVLTRQSKQLAKRYLPQRTQRWIRSTHASVWPPVGFVRFGSLRRLTPISKSYGDDRGMPIDRRYIEDFLQRHAGADGYLQGDIRGRVLEIGDDSYSRKFGGWTGAPGAGNLESVDILHGDESNPDATLVGDLADAPQIPSNSFDCVICTQTLLLIYDVRSAIRTLHRILKPGGVVLATVPGISKICRPEIDIWGDYWRFTSLSARRLFEEVFESQRVKVEAYGNVLTAIGMLHGLAAEELQASEFDLHDPNFEVVVSIRAMKSPN